MIKSITVTNDLGESKKLELKSPDKSGFIIQNIDGLGPSKSNILTTEVATNDGSIFNSARTTSRNIVMNLKFLFMPTIEEVRLESYKYFPNKKRVHLLIETDKRTCETYGYVESNEPNIFSKEEGTTISIICPDPYLYSYLKILTVFYGIEANFEFPFSNESLVDNLLELGIIRQETQQRVYYDGDADTGINIRIHIIGEVSNITIYNLTKREIMRIDTDKLASITGAPLASGEDILINTIKGNKSIYLLRNGEYINILNCLDRNTDWFQLSKGDNMFAFTADIGETNLQFQIEHRNAYEGV